MRSRACLILLLCTSGVMISAGPVSGENREFLFHAELPVPGEYTLFASGGWDGNWYAGYDRSWITQLPPVETAGYERAFLGARLGRSKTPEQIKEVHREEGGEVSEGPYGVLIGISREMKKRPAPLTLAYNDMIPREGSPVSAVKGVAESRWFWKEIELEEISSGSPNYIWLWSGDRELKCSRTAPILAAGIGSQDLENSYLVEEDEMKVIKYFEPALAIKLIPPDAPSPEIEITDFYTHGIYPHKKVVETGVRGDYITAVYLEINDGSGWNPAASPSRVPPYDIVFDPEKEELEPGSYNLRCRVVNWWENSDISGEVSFEVAE